MNSITDGVQSYIKKEYPHAHYILSYTHQPNLMIQNAASQHAKFLVFFNNLSAVLFFLIIVKRNNQSQVTKSNKNQIEL